MKSFSYIVFASLLILAGRSEAISKPKTTIDFYKLIVETLADDSMYGREAGSVYETKAAEFIFQEFEKLGTEKTAFQAFEFTHPDNGVVTQSKNVYAFIDHHAAKTILIGAHYDHIGLGGSKSLSLNKVGQIHNGADDNASGVALMLGLLQNLKQWEKPTYNYLFVAYSAHELGLFGSDAFMAFAKQRFPTIGFVINFDMVGRLDMKENILAIYGIKTIQSENAAFFNQTLPVNIRTEESDLIFQTDGKIFAKNKIPSLSFTTGTHDDYHKVSDDAQYINYAGMLNIQEVLQSFLSSLKI